MELIPLKQWICDSCGEIIKSPKDGYIQFKLKDFIYEDFVIVHHLPASPKKKPNGCYIYDSDSNLEEYLGEDGIAHLLSMIDLGHQIKDKFEGTYVANYRKWVEIFRRLHTSYLEEARLYWDKAASSGFFEGANEIWPYCPDNLKLLIEKYGKDSDKNG